MNWNSDPNDPRRYDDIIHLPHHVSETHPRMTRHDRAAQFAPFAALTGLDAVQPVREICIPLSALKQGILCRMKILTWQRRRL